MDAQAQLLVLKTVHSVIALFGASASFYILWCGITNRSGRLLWAAIVLTLIIGLLLAVNGGVCVLQSLARHIEGVDRGVSDIFLPDWAAQLIAPVFVPLTAVGYALVAWRRMQKRRSGASRH